jgi:hypothetical protein
LWKRVFLLPFVPSLWAEARHWPLGAVVFPLFLSAALWSGGLAMYRGAEFRSVLNELARDWDQRFDPLIIENGEARVEGTRLPEGGDDKTLMLADPEETRPVPSDRRYLIIRKRVIIRSDGPPVDLTTLQKTFGLGTLRIDGAALQAWVAKWGFTVKMGLLALLVGTEWIGTAFGLLYGMIAGALLMNLYGKTRALTSRGCTRVGIAVLAIKPVLGVVLALAGSSVNPCLGIILWPGLSFGLGAWALSRLPEVPSASPSA